MVSRTRYALPLDASLRAKFDSLADVFELRVLGRSAGGAAGSDPRFVLLPAWPKAVDGLAFSPRLAALIARELRTFAPDAVVAQGAHEAAAALAARALTGSRARVVAEVHGDWRTATRLYGSPLRRVLSPLADRLSVAALRRADAVRTVSPYTSALVREVGVTPAASFPAHMELEPFLGPRVPLPARPAALFVGVLEHYKGIDELARAWRRTATTAPDATLRVVGDGSRRHVVAELVAEQPARVTWTRRVPPAEIAAALDAATCLVLPSRSEGMGRVVVEAFCRGRPVVGTRVGGIADLVHDRVEGLLVEPRDPAALAAALGVLLSDEALAGELAANAGAAAEPWAAAAASYAQRTHELVTSTLGRRVSLPRALFVGRTRFRVPLDPPTQEKYDAIGRELDYLVLASAADGDGASAAPGRFDLAQPASVRLLDGPLYYLRLPLRVGRALRRFSPDAVFAEDPAIAGLVLLVRRAIGGRAVVIAEIHGDWRQATRLYGSRARRALAPLADALAGYGVRNADGVRALSPRTGAWVEQVRGRPPDAAFAAYVDYSAFTGRPPAPLPDRPTALFVGVLERYKNVDGLVAAWRLVAARLPEARLVVVGRGPLEALVAQLARDLPDAVEHHRSLSSREVAEQLDGATVLVLPSRSEGVPRVVLESLARGRGVVASPVGGVADVVREGVDGLLVDPADLRGIADAIVRVLGDRELAEALGAAAHARSAELQTTPEEFAARLRSLVDSVVD
jgi:glycosyltransferase involved in cell wall biosynthesis